jgi:hypothetical protein
MQNCHFSVVVGSTVEVAGPEKFRLDELIRWGLSARNDRREVVADPHARYFGAELRERTLVPRGDARLGETRFDDWLSWEVPGMAQRERPKTLVGGLHERSLATL